MKISLTPELEEIIRKKVATGQYLDESEVIRESLRFKLAHDDLVHRIDLTGVQHSFYLKSPSTPSSVRTDSVRAGMTQHSAPNVGLQEENGRSESDYVFSLLRENIYRGELKPGELLIGADRIAELMEVSLQSVDEAISLLVEAGFLEERKNNEFYVMPFEIQNSTNLFSAVITPQKSSLDELLEVRLGLETYGVGLAVERADMRDVQYMKEALNELTMGRPDKKKAQEADIKFHMGIAFASHNLVHIDLIRRFYDYMFHSISTLHELLYEEPHNLKIIDQHHFKILDAITGRDKKSAERYMLQHILFLKSFIRDKYLGGQ
ncbi:FCD domain-containing protein [Maridesulfovibrio sp.]|uniref:FCD domain-containing protein n=1 Tax=Maridesulfovibrio sp. TaxID=2795000 RepID=UPI002A188A3D|nr:FCD domain-containing protein [Maridesulfovibrio sp.]